MEIYSPLGLARCNKEDRERPRENRGFLRQRQWASNTMDVHESGSRCKSATTFACNENVQSSLPLNLTLATKYHKLYH